MGKITKNPPTGSLLKELSNLTRQGDQFLEKNDSKQFHLFAADLLSKKSIHQKFDLKTLSLEVLNDQFNVDQNFKFFEFSDFPVTVARGEHCFIDLYFWRRRPTTVHNHHFKGAFQCLIGNNSDSEFEWIPSKKLTKFHAVGDLKLLKKKDVRPGDIQEIDLQDKFIHQNHHHDELTVNLCFRTTDNSGKNLSNFLYSGFKYEKDSKLMARTHRLMAMMMFQDVNVPLTLPDAVNFILEMHFSGRSHPRLLKLEKVLHKRIRDELGVSMADLLKRHEKALDDIQDEYN